MRKMGSLERLRISAVTQRTVTVTIIHALVHAQTGFSPLWETPFVLPPRLGFAFPVVAAPRNPPLPSAGGLLGFLMTSLRGGVPPRVVVVVADEPGERLYFRLAGSVVDSMERVEMAVSRVVVEVGAEE